MPRKQVPATTKSSERGARQTIIEAAAKCFEQYGPQRTSMDDIAQAAGISRKTLYRVFSDRPKLVQAILEWRWAKIGKKVQLRIAKSATFEEALVEGSVTGVSGTRNDKLANDIIRKATDHTLEQFLLRGNERTYKGSLEVWQAAIDKGREEGVIKGNLNDERIIEIIISIHSLLILRDDSPAKQRAFINDVLLPAIAVA